MSETSQYFTTWIYAQIYMFASMLVESTESYYWYSAQGGLANRLHEVFLLNEKHEN